jgi:hypothetical protein
VDAALDGTDANFKQSGITSPAAPSATQDPGSSGSAGFTALALSEQETGSSQAAISQSGGSQSGTATTSTVSNIGSASTSVATTSASAAGAGSDPTVASSALGVSPTTQNLAIDRAVSEFELADMWI